MQISLKMLQLCICFVLILPLTMQGKIKYDKEHLKFDFAGILDSFVKVISNSELDFRYFMAHDHDKNRRLDGLELLYAMKHEEEHPSDDPDHHNNSGEFTMQYYEEEIDSLLNSYDTDFNGFLDYKEFSLAQKGMDDLGLGGNLAQEL